MTSDRIREVELAIGKIPLLDSDVERILEIYRPEHRYVTQATLDGLKLRCVLKRTVYPYTTHDIFPYITAPTATVYSCQLAYVLVGGLALKSPAIATSLGGGNWSEFLVQRDRAWLRFTSFSTHFRSEVVNADELSAAVGIVRIRNFRSNLHCVMEFEIGHGISGAIRGVIVGG